MIALISNDDGYYSEGVRALFECSQPFFDECHVIAPDRDCSGRSSCLTLRQPIFANTRRNGFIAVEANPADCVQIGLSDNLIPMPNMVLSGINHGANLADDVIYSGTLAAAIEGRFLDRPAIGFSVNSANPVHWESIKAAVTEVLKMVLASDMRGGIVLNVNIPDIEDIKGIKITQLGKRDGCGKAQIKYDHRQRRQFWVGHQGEPIDVTEKCDFYAIEQGYVSVTPLMFDLTDYAAIDLLSKHV